MEQGKKRLLVRNSAAAAAFKEGVDLLCSILIYKCKYKYKNSKTSRWGKRNVVLPSPITLASLSVFFARNRGDKVYKYTGR